MNDLERGIDLRGDPALFIETSHFDAAGSTLDVDVGELTFFRVIDQGAQTRSHGWAEGMEVVQWG